MDIAFLLLFSVQRDFSETWNKSLLHYLALKTLILSTRTMDSFFLGASRDTC